MTDQIIQFVTERTGVTYEQMQSPRRHREWVQARQAAMWLMRRNTSISLKAIANIFGGRDHSTVIHSCDLVDDMLAIRDRSFQFVKNFKRTELAPIWEDEYLLEVCG